VQDLKHRLYLCMLAEKECEGLSRQCCTAGPSQNATFPNFNSSRIIHVPTDLTYVLARVLVFNDSDQAAANALSQNITINPYNVSGLVLHASLLLFRDVYNTQMHSACSADNVATDIVLADLGLFTFAQYMFQAKMHFAGTATKAAQISAAFNGSGYGSSGTQVLMLLPCCSGQPPGSTQLLLMSRLIPQVFIAK